VLHLSKDCLAHKAESDSLLIRLPFYKTVITKVQASNRGTGTKALVQDGTFQHQRVACYSHVYLSVTSYTAPSGTT